MKFLFLGDVVGRAGRRVVAGHLPEARERLGLDYVVANAENAAGGFGMTEKVCNQLYEAGVDVLTSGNHVWAKREIVPYIDEDARVLRPKNFPEGTPGDGFRVYDAPGGARVAVLNVMGRIFMDPLDDPFACVERAFEAAELGSAVDFFLVDFHAEATSEKMAMGHYCDGRASLVVGTHTHVPTADHMILPKGTAYLSDAGMCGDYDSVIGMAKDEPLRRFVTKIGAGPFVPAEGEATMCGVYVESDDRSGLARSIAPLRIGGCLAPAWPE